MFRGTVARSPVCVLLPADSAGSELLLPVARREPYFGFYFFAYAPALSRWSASGRLDRK
jgi:hypothetical protein